MLSSEESSIIVAVAIESYNDSPEELGSPERCPTLSKIQKRPAEFVVFCYIFI